MKDLRGDNMQSIVGPTDSSIQSKEGILEDIESWIKNTQQIKTETLKLC